MLQRNHKAKKKQKTSNVLKSFLRIEPENMELKAFPLTVTQRRHMCIHSILHSPSPGEKVIAIETTPLFKPGQ